MAQLSLAFCYFDGIGTQKNNTQAVFWATKARDAGLENAGRILENMKEIVALERKLSIYDDSKSSSNAHPSGTIVLIMRKMNSVYYVPCKINGLKADSLLSR